MRVLITGGGGRIGRALSWYLTQAGHEVRSADIHRTKSPHWESVVENLLNREACYRLVLDCEAVIHLGNHPRPQSTNDQRLVSENVSMNMNVFQAAVESDVRKIIFASSVHAFNGSATLAENKPSELPYLPLDGDIPPNAGSSYGLSKVLGEAQLRYYQRNYRVEATALRLPWVARDVQETIERSKEYMRKGYRDRFMLRDEAFQLIGRRDIARLIELLLERDLPGYRCYFPASRQNILGLPAHELADEFFPDVPRRKELAQLGSLADVSAITDLLGWEPTDEADAPEITVED